MSTLEKVVVSFLGFSKACNRFILPEPDKVCLDTIFTNLQHYLFSATILALGLWMRTNLSPVSSEVVGGVLILIGAGISLLAFMQSLLIGQSMIWFDKLPLDWIGRIKSPILRILIGFPLILGIMAAPACVFMIAASWVILAFLLQVGAIEQPNQIQENNPNKAEMATPRKPSD